MLPAGGGKKRVAPPPHSREREARAGDREPIALAAGQAAVVEAAGVVVGVEAASAAAVGERSQLRYERQTDSRNDSHVGR